VKKLSLALATIVAALGIGLGFAATASATDIPVATIAPVWHAATCTDTPGNEGNVDIPDAGPGVIYALDSIPGPAGNYLLGLGTHTVTAGAQAGYTLTGTVTWTYTVVKPNCKVTPKAPVWHAATCAQPAGSVDIPTVKGVDYAVDYIPGPAGNYLLGVGAHTVSANPQPGYTLSGTQTWTYTVKKVTGCHKIVVRAPVRKTVTPAVTPVVKHAPVLAPRPVTHGAPIAGRAVMTVLPVAVYAQF